MGKGREGWGEVFGQGGDSDCLKGFVGKQTECK